MALESVLGIQRGHIRRAGNYHDLEEDVRIPEDVLQCSADPCKMFTMPACPPKAFVNQHFGANSKMQFAKGTTTLAFIYEGATPADKGGIVVAVDSRASSGLYVSSKTVLKVLPITKHIVGTMAGGAADCQFWIRLLAKQCTLYELENKDKITVAAASKCLQNILYDYKGMGLSIGTMITGFDKRGPSLYYVDGEGNRCKGEKFSVGSGQMNAYGILDTFYKAQMTDAEAIDLGRRAIMHAKFRDSGSGGGCNVFHITKDDGWKQLDRIDVSDMYYDFMVKNKREFHVPNQI